MQENSYLVLPLAGLDEIHVYALSFQYCTSWIFGNLSSRLPLNLTLTPGNCGESEVAGETYIHIQFHSAEEQFSEQHFVLNLLLACM